MVSNQSVTANLNNDIVEDEIVIDLVHKAIAECEAERQSYIVQGFPRTRAQAQSISKHQIIPDKVI